MKFKRPFVNYIPHDKMLEGKRYLISALEDAMAGMAPPKDEQEKEAVRIWFARVIRFMGTT